MNIENKIRTSIEQEKLENELSHKKYELENLNEEMAKENKQLKDNWNKLKEYLNYKSERAVGEDEYVYDEIYNEMQELEQGSDNQ